MPDGRIVPPAAVTVGDRSDGVDLQLATAEQVFLVGRPAPAVGQVGGNHGRYLPDVHHDGGDVFHVVLFGHLLDVADDVEDDAQFVHDGCISF